MKTKSVIGGESRALLALIGIESVAPFGFVIGPKHVLGGYADGFSSCDTAAKDGLFGFFEITTAEEFVVVGFNVWMKPFEG